MKLRALLPLVTYPDANSDAVITNADCLRKFGRQRP